MRIEEVTVSPAGDQVELAATVGGFRVWYRLPASWPAVPRGDAFMAPGLMAAMVRGEPLEVEDAAPVSPRLLSGMGRIADVLRTWDPAFRDIPIRARPVEAPAGPPGVACFYSGGVDSAYTVHKHAQAITHLILVRGSDIRLDDHALFDEVLRRNQQVASTFGKALVVVETNSRALNRSLGIDPFLYYGAILAGVALALGFTRTYVSAGQTYVQLWPAGAHLLIDPHWSTETSEIVHDGAEARRSEKLRAVAGSPILLDNLRVCLQGGRYNCGACEKCLRTMVTLRLLGLRAEALPPVTSMGALRALRIVDDAQLAYCWDNYDLALESGDREVARALRSLMVGYSLRHGLREVDDLMFGGRLLRARRRLLGQDPDAPAAVRRHGRARRQAPGT